MPEFEGWLHPAAYGDSAFEAILAHIETFDLPACIQRLEVDDPDVPVKIVGYIVAHRGEDGKITCESHIMPRLRAMVDNKVPPIA